VVEPLVLLVLVLEFSEVVWFRAAQYACECA